jgi:hypothetical protein
VINNVRLGVRKLIKRIVFGMMLMLLLPGMLTVAPNLIVQASPETILYVDPSSIVDPTLVQGSTFTVDLIVSDVEFLFAWQVNMSYGSAVLKCVNLIEGEFLANQPNGTIGASEIENDEGWAVFGWSTLGAHIGVSGSGTLATIEYEVLAEGESPLKIETEPFQTPLGNWVYPTQLIAQSKPHPPSNFYDIIFTAENGYFSNSGAVPPFPTTIAELKTEIEELGLEGEIAKGTVRSLNAKLNLAQKMVYREKIDKAKLVLENFIKQAQNLSGIHITPEATDILIESAEYILAHL